MYLLSRFKLALCKEIVVLLGRYLPYLGTVGTYQGRYVIKGSRQENSLHSGLMIAASSAPCYKLDTVLFQRAFLTHTVKTCDTASPYGLIPGRNKETR